MYYNPLLVVIHKTKIISKIAFKYTAIATY